MSRTTTAHGALATVKKQMRSINLSCLMDSIHPTLQQQSFQAVLLCTVVKFCRFEVRLKAQLFPPARPLEEYLTSNSLIRYTQFEKSQERKNQKIKELQKKLQKLENTLSKLQTIDLDSHPIPIRQQRTQQVQQPTQNMGEQAFLASLQWAFQAGDTATCKKLITWRRSLLKLGRIAGWDIALSVGIKTFRRKQICSDDIIEANYDFIMKQGIPKT